MATQEAKTRKQRQGKAPDPITVNNLAMRLTLSQKVELVKTLKQSISEETAKLSVAAKEAADLTKDI